MESPWRRVLGSRNDQALITLTGLDVIAFKAILQSFKYYYDHYTPFIEGGTIQMLYEAIWQGQPRLITALDGLGLALTWTWTCGSTFVPRLIFEMTLSSTFEYLAILYS